MREIIPDLLRWHRQGIPAAIATVIKTWGSAPRPAGSRMAIAANQAFTGSVSGGCVEAAVVAEAQNVIQTGRPKRLEFGVSDDTAWSVGLTCGGKLEVFIEPFDDRALLETCQHRLAAGEVLVLATVTRGEPALPGRHLLLTRDGACQGSLTDAGLIAFVRQAAPPFFQRENCALLPFRDGELFLETCLPPPKLIIVGAVHLAVPLAHLARTLDFRVILLDPRSQFATAERFPHVDQIVRGWPEQALAEIGIDAGTCVVVLTHDPKLDDPAIITALRHHPAYLGVLGSRKTHEKRVRRLREAGVPEEQLQRIHAPIGLNLGALTPAEIAVSIMAEIIAQRRLTPAAGMMRP
ncbi:MAG: XdhC family protein [candidate division KSB1 bacterium]|nr:XdhC family protein [candidate division KSB1 bacterium]MDZ7275076.1 XdhC family protein [candidate division KSB1 bacterium]MDZ7286476.1 XdhC family protein [candidate division KSB1 bacterium]MDZ7299360.1 XdhC family protein [candidate division KSB1 bacterium]MDZ7306311.1 XdhC family protein [candidate division KSB1 bacterium]